MKLFSLMMFLCSIQTFAAGFSAGENFTTERISGNIMISCVGPNMSTVGTAHCVSENLNPAEYSYFVGSKIDATEVVLQATDEQGRKSTIKKEKYDSVLGKSKKPFNLWIATVFQRPLLNYGKNNIEYKLLKNGLEVESGNFMVEVATGASRQCTRGGYYYSNNLNDCSFPQSYCSRYFMENNYCR